MKECRMKTNLVNEISKYMYLNSNIDYAFYLKINAEALI